ncbi:3805_t:CDS:2, partial [Cetraspora pellucida]
IVVVGIVDAVIVEAPKMKWMFVTTIRIVEVFVVGVSFRWLIVLMAVAGGSVIQQ